MGNRRNNLCLSRLAATVLLAFCGSVAAQSLYKWTDEDGNVHYGDKPPAGTADESIALEAEGPSARDTIAKLPVSIEESEEGGIARFVLFANEVFSSHSQTPSQLVVADGTLWLTFEDSLLSFDPSTKTSIKYKLDRIRYGLSGQRMRISGDHFIFFPTSRDVSVDAFYVYNHMTDAYKELTIRTKSNYIIPYEDRHNDGIFGFAFQSKSIVQYTGVTGVVDEELVEEFIYQVDNSDGGIHALSVNSDAIWYFSGYRKNCSVGFFGKQESTGRSFNSDEIGIPASNSCAFIVADDDEVWVTSVADRRDATLAVYDVEDQTWDVLERSTNNIEFSLSPLQMDAERVYYNYCDRLIAVDRETRESKMLAIDGDPTDRHTSCIHAFNIYDDHVWALVFEPSNHRKYPVLYRIPAEMMSP